MLGHPSGSVIMSLIRSAVRGEIVSMKQARFSRPCHATQHFQSLSSRSMDRRVGLLKTFLSKPASMPGVL